MILIPLSLSAASLGRQHQLAVWLRDVAVYSLSPEPRPGTGGPHLSLTKRKGD